MKNISLKDIYAGKPDAKDEIVFNGIDDFLETLIVPSNFNMDGIIAGDKFFITGLKGTGKTALIFHLDVLLRERDKSACTSFIFFNLRRTTPPFTSPVLVVLEGNNVFTFIMFPLSIFLVSDP